MPGKSDFRNRTITTVVRPKDFDLQRVSKVVVKEHFHASPTCDARTHDPKCGPFGREISCVRVIVDYKRTPPQPNRWAGLSGVPAART